MSFPTWVTKIGPFAVKRQNWGRTGYGYQGYKPRLCLHTTETTGFPDYGSGASQPHLTIRLSGNALAVRQHQSLNIGARALLGKSTNTANCIQVEQVMYSDGNIAKRVNGLWVGSLSATQLETLGEFYAALARLCGMPTSVYSGRRMAQSPWLSRNGWAICEHADVPQNSHWDCGVLAVASAVAKAGADAGSQVGSSGSSKPKTKTSKYSRHGLTYSEVKSVQHALNDHFGARLLVDGSYGPDTIAAVKVAQEALGVTADSIWGDATQAAYDKRWLKKHPPKKAKGGPKLRNGSRGKSVTNLQGGLMRVFPTYAGPIKRTGGADGKFGPGTEKVVREFQKRSHLAVDGVVGKATWAALSAYHINP